MLLRRAVGAHGMRGGKQQLVRRLCLVSERTTHVACSSRKQCRACEFSTPPLPLCRCAIAFALFCVYLSVCLFACQSLSAFSVITCVTVVLFPFPFPFFRFRFLSVSVFITVLTCDNTHNHPLRPFKHSSIPFRANHTPSSLPLLTPSLRFFKTLTRLPVRCPRSAAWCFVCVRRACLSVRRAAHPLSTYINLYVSLCLHCSLSVWCLSVVSRSRSRALSLSPFLSVRCFVSVFSHHFVSSVSSTVSLAVSQSLSQSSAQRIRVLPVHSHFGRYHSAPFRRSSHRSARGRLSAQRSARSGPVRARVFGCDLFVVCMEFDCHLVRHSLRRTALLLLCSSHFTFISPPHSASLLSFP